MMRRIVAVIAGLLVVGAVVGALQAISGALFPLPADLDPFNPEHADRFSEYLETLPFMGWAIAFGSEVLGAFLGAWAAGAISPDRKRIASGIVVGAAVVGSVYNWTAFAHPSWFMIGQVVLYPVALLGVWRLLEGKGSPADESAPSAVM